MFIIQTQRIFIYTETKMLIAHSQAAPHTHKNIYTIALNVRKRKCDIAVANWSVITHKMGAKIEFSGNDCCWLNGITQTATATRRQWSPKKNIRYFYTQNIGVCCVLKVNLRMNDVKFLMLLLHLFRFPPPTISFRIPVLYMYSLCLYYTKQQSADFARC